MPVLDALHELAAHSDAELDSAIGDLENQLAILRSIRKAKRGRGNGPDGCSHAGPRSSGGREDTFLKIQAFLEAAGPSTKRQIIDGTAVGQALPRGPFKENAKTGMWSL